MVERLASMLRHKDARFGKLHLEIAAEKKVIGQHHASLETDRADVSGDGGERKAEIVGTASEENCAVNGKHPSYGNGEGQNDGARVLTVQKS